MIQIPWAVQEITNRWNDACAAAGTLISATMDRRYFALLHDPYASQLKIGIYEDHDEAVLDGDRINVPDAEIQRFTATEDLLNGREPIHMAGDARHVTIRFSRPVASGSPAQCDPAPASSHRCSRSSSSGGKSAIDRRSS